MSRRLCPQRAVRTVLLWFYWFSLLFYCVFVIGPFHMPMARSGA